GRHRALHRPAAPAVGAAHGGLSGAGRGPARWGEDGGPRAPPGRHGGGEGHGRSRVTEGSWSLDWSANSALRWTMSYSTSPAPGLVSTWSRLWLLPLKT